MSGAADSLKRLLIGRALASNRLGETLLPKRLALPVFCSDPISSVAYATEQIVLVLGTAGTASFLGLAAPISVAVAVLLAVVVASYRQTCFAYPSGGGAYVVSKENLGRNASLTAAAALLVDYVMTVAVSVVSGVVAIISALPGLAPYAVQLSVGFVLLLALVNLRGVKESGTVFAFPTYAFVALTMLLLASGVYRALNGGVPEAGSAHLQLEHTAQVGGVFTLLLCLRAFASGCTALTGVEAISNGVPAFQKPKSKNAAATLLIMGVLAITMFSGITALALATGARAYGDGNPSVISQIAETVWGRGLLFYGFQAATARDPGARGEHGVQRFPDSGLDPGAGPFPACPAAQPGRPSRVQQRNPAAGGNLCCPDHRLQRQHREAHPALHRRRLRLVHPLPVRDGAPLARRAVADQRRRPPPRDPPLAADQRHRRSDHQPGSGPRRGL